MTSEETTKKKKKKPAKVESTATKTPELWCYELKRFSFGRRPERKMMPHWQHSAAAALHGWAHHAHEANEPIQITKSAYLAALEAVERSPLTPHADAVSPYLKSKG
jgi:hypothetical protein